MPCMRHVDPVDQDASRQAALRRAARAAFWNGARPATFRSLVVKSEVEARRYRRVAHRIEKRAIVLQFAPASGSRANQVAPLPSPRGLEPWAVDPARLPAASEKLCVCPQCAGEKKVACPKCDGEARVRCPRCWGSGRVSGKRGLKNCPSCRGRATVQCKACTRGRVECPTCAGGGRVRAWLEVESSISVQIKVHPQSDLTDLHRDLHAVEDLDRDPGAYRVPRVHDSGWVNALSEALPLELEPRLDPVAERVIRQREQAFQADVFHLMYTTRTSTGVVHVAGNPPGILAGSDWWPLRRRLGLAIAAGLVMFFAAALLLGAYQARADWFRDHGNGGPMSLLGVLAAIVTSALVARAWLPQPLRGSKRIKVYGAAIAAAWLGMLALWLTGGPTLESIQASLARDDLQAARREADALQAIHASPAGLEDTLRLLAEREDQAERARRGAEDEQHLAQVTGAPTLAGAVESLRVQWWSEDVAREARAAVLARARAEVEQHDQAGDSAALTEVAGLLAPIDPELATGAQVRSALARAGDCLAQKDFACAIGELDAWKQQLDGDPATAAAHQALRDRCRTELRRWLTGASFEHTDLAERKLAIERAIVHAQLYDSAFGKPSPVPVQRLRAQLARTEKQIENARRRAARLEQRRQAAAEREARRRAAAQERRWRGSGGLRCNDGTLSPTCTCGGSWRGCCSHHGGVAGCD